MVRCLNDQFTRHHHLRGMYCRDAGGAVGNVPPERTTECLESL